MTLATRCSACGTSFRVVQDQLKVSGGWVRCGRCNEVFNAIEGLYEVGSPMAEPTRRVAQPPPPPSPPPTPAHSPPPPPPAPTPVPPPAAALAPSLVATPRLPEPEPAPFAAASPALDSGHQEAGASQTPPAPDVPAEAALQGDSRDNDKADSDVELADEWLEPVEPVAATAADAEAPPVPAPQAEAPLVSSPADDWRSDDWPAHEPTPSFIVAAQRAERRRHPGSRLAWGSVAVLLLALLGLQAGLAYRDVIAARWPGARPALQQACGWIGCRVEPLRHIAALSVEASGLQQVGSAPVYTLSVALRNRSDTEVMMPALDLVLSDSQGRTIARKVLTMADLGRPARSLGALAEIAGQATLSTGGQRVAGYTIEIFYP